MKCGIVILNYNSHDLTVALAEKCADFNSVSDICVVDNNSEDNFDGDFSHSKIHYIKNKANTGYSAGNNVGLRYLIENKKCDYVFIANPDTVFEDETISTLCGILDENSDIALISCKRYGHNNQTIHQFFDFPDCKTSVKNCFFIPRRKFEANRHSVQNTMVDEANDILYVDAVPGAFFGLRAEFLRKNNYLYEGIFLYGEEIILGRQAHNMGYRACLTNKVTYVHDHIGARFSNRKMFYLDRKSLKKYYDMFENLSMLQKATLNVAIWLGTAEYSCAYYLYHLLKKVKK